MINKAGIETKQETVSHINVKIEQKDNYVQKIALL